MENTKTTKIEHRVILTDEQKNRSMNDRFTTPTNINRFTATVIDFVIASLIVGLGLLGLLAGIGSIDYYASRIVTIEEKITIAQLRFPLITGDNGLVMLPFNDGDTHYMARIFPADSNQVEYSTLRPLNDDAHYSDYAIVQSLAYYYCSYTANNTAKLRQNQTRDDGTIVGYEYVGSDYADIPVTSSSGEKILPIDYYTIEWFNKNILEISSNGVDEKGLFELKDGDWNKVATPKLDSFRNQTAIDFPDATFPLNQQKSSTSYDAETDYTLTDSYFADSKSAQLTNLFIKKYTDARVHFFDSQPSIQAMQDEVEAFSDYLVWSIILATILIYFLVIPLCLPRGNTIGKLLFKIGIVNRQDGFIAKKWQVALRSLPFLIFAVLGFILRMDIVVLIMFVAFLLVECAFVLFGKKLSISDLMSYTALTDYGRIPLFKNEEFENAFFIEENVSTAVNKVQPDINEKYDSRKTHAKKK